MDSFSPFLIGFLIGVIVGVIAHSYITEGKKAAIAESTPTDLGAIIAEQIKHQQTQNMMRQMQLEQARQEAEFRQLEQERVKYLGLSQKPDYTAIVAAVSRELERQGQPLC